MKLEFNDLVAARLPGGQQVIFQFASKGVPGVVQLVKEDYNKQGQWSASYWEVVLAEEAIGFVRAQDWETGEWLNSRRWPEAIAEFTGSEALDADAVERFIRATWKNVAVALDRAAEEEKADGSPALAELLAAQEALAEAQTEAAAVAAAVARLGGA